MAESIISPQASVLANSNTIERFTPTPPSTQRSPPRARVKSTVRGVARQVDWMNSWQRVSQHDWPDAAIFP